MGVCSSGRLKILFKGSLKLETVVCGNWKRVRSAPGFRVWDEIHSPNARNCLGLMGSIALPM